MEGDHSQVLRRTGVARRAADKLSGEAIGWAQAGASGSDVTVWRFYALFAFTGITGYGSQVSTGAFRLSDVLLTQGWTC